jgi:hypothetical protein
MDPLVCSPYFFFLLQRWDGDEYVNADIGKLLRSAPFASLFVIEQTAKPWSIELCV